VNATHQCGALDRMQGDLERKDKSKIAKKTADFQAKID